MRRDLDGREYKVLLNPDRIGTDKAAIDAFYEDRLRPILASGDRRIGGKFGKPSVREIHFFDTADRVLDRASFALRRRSNGGDAEVTLKLRTPDIFVVAATKLPAKHRRDAETTFEEDVAPLEVATKRSEVKVADPPSIHSRFALSTKQPLRGDLKNLRSVSRLYPTLHDNLRRARVGFEPSEAILEGPTIRELVFDGLCVDLGGSAAAALVLTLWELAPPAKIGRVTEVSYRCRIVKGRMPGKVAREALALFLALQTGLGAFLELRYPSKTALALPAQGDK